MNKIKNNLGAHAMFHWEKKIPVNKYLIDALLTKKG